MGGYGTEERHRMGMGLGTGNKQRRPQAGPMGSQHGTSVQR